MLAKKICLLAVIVAVLVPVALAEVLHMKDGRKQEGMIVKESDKSVTIKVLSGTRIGEISIPRSEIESIERTTSLVEKYLAKREEFPERTPLDKKMLAAWCFKNDLIAMGNKHLEDAKNLFKKQYLEENPDARCGKCAVTGEVACPGCHGKKIVEKICEKCKGRQYIRCSECDGRGTVKCEKCGGTGSVKVRKGSSYVNETCPDCGGRGFLNCPECGGRGKVKCSECDGAGRVREKCPECNGKGKVTCPDCDGTGILKEYHNDFKSKFDSLGEEEIEVTEKDEPEKVEKEHERNTPEKDENKNAAKPEKDDTPPGVFYINVYRKDATGAITGEVEMVFVPLYLSRNPVGDTEIITRLEDNTEVKIIFEDGEKVKIKTRKGKTGWVEKKNLRAEKYTYYKCAACMGEGFVPCPACRNGVIEIDGKDYPCRVCGGKGKVKCIHCKGLGKVRKK